MDTSDKQWMFGGALAVMAASSAVFFSGMPSELVPIPTHILILAWVLSYASIFVLPIVYVVVFKLLHKKDNFGKIILGLSIVFALLSIIYFIFSWEYGIKWQGEFHTHIVAVINAIGFFVLGILAIVGLRKESIKLQYTANLFLFLLLSWCVFPVLGELP